MPFSRDLEYDNLYPDEDRTIADRTDEDAINVLMEVYESLVRGDEFSAIVMYMEQYLDEVGRL